MQNTIYKDEILEHYRNPFHFGPLKIFTKKAEQVNPFCGDEITIYIHIENELVKDVSFIGKGCAISVASTSILLEYAKDKQKKLLTNFTEEDMLSMLGIEISETRKKCALLGYFVLRDCLNQS